MPKVPAEVNTPSPEERNGHCETHLPYRNRWPICVQAKKRNPAHKLNASDGANKHVPVIATDYIYMNEMTDDTNSPIQVIHDSCSEGVWAVFTKKKGDSARTSSEVFGYSKKLIKSDQEPAVRSIERNEVESLFEDDFKASCGCQVVMQHSRVGRVSRQQSHRERDSASARTGQSHQVGLGNEHQGQDQPITNDMAWFLFLPYLGSSFQH